MDPRLLFDQPLRSLDEYRATGGGAAIEKLDSPEEAIEELARAGLRGRGGAGFPTAVKWRAIRDGGGRHHYAVCNAAEGEPGTFKDRALLRTNPYAVVEGLIAAARVVGADEAYIGLKESFPVETTRVADALTEMADAGMVGDLTITVTSGPEEYLFGEEKALLEVIEGKEPLPRWLPPYLHGLHATAPQLGWQSSEPDRGHENADHVANPTLVNNAETLAQAAWILTHGADAFRTVGTEHSPGTILCTMVGAVRAAGVFEIPMGTTLREAVDLAGGPHPGRHIRAAVPGAANAVVTADALDVPLTYEDMEAIGSGLGAAGFTLYDDTVCMVEVAATFSRFLYVESCGQCLPCKMGTGAVTAAIERIRDGSGSLADLDLIQSRLEVVADGNRCYLPVQEQNLISSVLREFPDDFEAHLDGECPAGGPEIPTPKITDIVEGVALYDERQERKNPDWTYG